MGKLKEKFINHLSEWHENLKDTERRYLKVLADERYMRYEQEKEQGRV